MCALALKPLIGFPLWAPPHAPACLPTTLPASPCRPRSPAGRRGHPADQQALAAAAGQVHVGPAVPRQQRGARGGVQVGRGEAAGGRGGGGARPTQGWARQTLNNNRYNTTPGSARRVCVFVQGRDACVHGNLCQLQQRVPAQAARRRRRGWGRGHRLIWVGGGGGLQVTVQPALPPPCHLPTCPPAHPPSSAIICPPPPHTHTRCIWYGPDDQGLNGTYLGLNVVKEASRALTVAITKVGQGWGWGWGWAVLGGAGRCCGWVVGCRRVCGGGPPASLACCTCAHVDALEGARGRGQGGSAS